MASGSATETDTSDSGQYVDPPIRDPAHLLGEEGPWASKAVLSFDGGGIRGFSSLLILEAIMTQIQELERNHEAGAAYSSSYSPWMTGERGETRANGVPEPCLDNYLPCHYFDYMAGTSTGGLTSIMLGRLRMPVGEAMRQYEVFGNAIFGKPRWSHARSILWYPRAKYSTRDTRTVFQKIILQSLKRDHGDGVEFHQAQSEPFEYRRDRTRVIVISFSIRLQGVGRPFLWKSYENSLTASERLSFIKPPTIQQLTGRGLGQIWQVARATTAAPGYFAPIQLGERQFLDGGMAANNPSLLALREVCSLHSPPALFVSIGTGLKEYIEEVAEARRQSSGHDPERRSRLKRLKNILVVGRGWKNMILDCEGVHGHDGWLERCNELGIQDDAYRLNVTGALSDMALDDWRPSRTGKTTLDLIREVTNKYLQQDEIRQSISDIARKAVAIRRQRAVTEKWETFAVDVVYRCRRCSEAPGKMNNNHFEDREGLRQHLQLSPKHRGQMTDDQIEQAIQAGRISG